MVIVAVLAVVEVVAVMVLVLVVLAVVWVRVWTRGAIARDVCLFPSVVVMWGASLFDQPSVYLYQFSLLPQLPSPSLPLIYHQGTNRLICLYTLPLPSGGPRLSITATHYHRHRHIHLCLPVHVCLDMCVHLCVYVTTLSAWYQVVMSHNGAPRTHRMEPMLWRYRTGCMVRVNDKLIFQLQIISPAYPMIVCMPKRYNQFNWNYMILWLAKSKKKSKRKGKGIKTKS